MKVKSPRLFWTAHLTFLGVLCLWFSPITHAWCVHLDEATFYLLNSSLTHNHYWQYFWGVLNHKREVSLNLVMAACVNLLAIGFTSDLKLRMLRLKQTLYFWAFFQVGFMLQAHLFNTLLQIERHSPSLVLQPVAKLSIMLENNAIKDTSYHSFPSGHAFALMYWTAFTWCCAPKKIALFGMVIAIILSLARLFSGAHWLSDTGFSLLLGLVWLSWVLNVPLYDFILKQPHRQPST